MARSLIWAILLPILLLLLLACGRIQNEWFARAGDVQSSSRLEMKVELPKDLRVGRATEIRVRIADGDKPVDGASVALESNMTHAGMEPLLANAPESEPGTYMATLEWTMGGGVGSRGHGSLT